MKFQKFEKVLMMSTALSTILAASMQQSSPLPQHLPEWVEKLAPSSHQPHSLAKGDSDLSAESDHRDKGPEILEFLDDEGLAPDVPAFTGLFRPALFKSLLHKARLTTNLGAADEQPSTSRAEPGPHDTLFKMSKQEKECIPCPQLFTDVIQAPWGQLGSSTSPSNLDKKLYCPAPKLYALLELPAVDPPVASLTSSSVLSADPRMG